MEADKKRKRPAEDWEDRRKRRIGGGVAGKPRGSGGADEAATAGLPAAADNVEDEVEEFFAIVRRMHAAARQFAAGQMPRGQEEEGKGFYRWRPAFEWEDFEEGGHHRLPDTSDGGCRRRGEVASATSTPIGAATGRGGKREERPAEDGTAVSLDLNAEPEPERVVG